ncbi:hypothetical protein PR048_007483 [Dryococelus australis]|uniref:HTH psq-type domain-containing protein n=1 Tax=Dryococelus australis TaxID=614101 RepID=A0ABQ9HUD1_9NEOP|nr:hypothetical protein PR048_007483 [Dryococelus australis]
MGTFKAAKHFNVPLTTLERRVQKVRDGKSYMEEAEKVHHKKKRNSNFSKASPDYVVKILHSERNTTKSRRSGKTSVLTSTPNKDELVAAESVKQIKSKVCHKRPLNQEKSSNVSKKTQKVTCRLFGESSKSKTHDSSSNFDEDSDDASCVYCNELYSRYEAQEG